MAKNQHTKLFKIGEYAFYGMWRLTVKDGVLTCQGIDYSIKAMHDLEEVQDERVFDLTATNVQDIQNYLEEVSTSAWADFMLKWVKKVYPDFDYQA